MSLQVAVPIARCCPEHPDWPTLATHLCAEFPELPMRVIVDELTRAKNAVEWLCMDLPDALDCAELMVRQCVISAVGVGPGDRQPRVMFPPASPRDLARSRTSGDGRFR